MFPLALLHDPAVEADTDGRTKNESTLFLVRCLPDLMTGSWPTRVAWSETTSHSPVDCAADALANSVTTTTVDVCSLSSATTLHTFVTRPHKFDSGTDEVVAEVPAVARTVTAATPIDTLLAISCLIPTVYPVMVVPQIWATTQNNGTTGSASTTRTALSPVKGTVRIHCHDPRTAPIDRTSIERWWPASYAWWSWVELGGACTDTSPVNRGVFFPHKRKASPPSITTHATSTTTGPLVPCCRHASSVHWWVVPFFIKWKQRRVGPLPPPPPPESPFSVWTLLKVGP
jgi:hypothetical protein